MSIDWGSVPAWVAAVGAVAALIFTAIAATSSRAQIGELRAENERSRERERRALAACVTIYISTQHLGNARKPVLWYINSSGLPIYGLTIYCFTSTESMVRSYRVNGPRPERVEMGWFTRRLLKIFDSRDPGEALTAGELAAACSFRDAYGLWWYRTVDGELGAASDGDAAASAARKSGPFLIQGAQVQLAR